MRQRYVWIGILGIFLLALTSVRPSLSRGTVGEDSSPLRTLALEGVFQSFFNPASPLPAATHGTLTLRGEPLLWETRYQQALPPQSMRWRMSLALGEGLNPYLSLETDALTHQPMPWQDLLQASGARQIRLVGCAQAPEATEQLKVLFYLDPPHPRQPPGWLLLWQACEDSGCGYGLRLYATAPNPTDHRLFLADTDPLLPTESCASLLFRTP